MSRALPSKMQACWSETHTVLFTPIARCLKCLIHVTHSVNVTQLHSLISSLHKTPTFPVNALQLREDRELDRMPLLVRKRQSQDSRQPSVPPAAHSGSSSSTASSWRSTQDIRSEEAGLACVSRGTGVTQALSFLGKEVSPNLRLARVTKAGLSPPPAVSPSRQEAARPCLPRLLLPSAASVCSGSSHSLILARGPPGIHCISSAGSVALRFLVQCHGPGLSPMAFIPSANPCGVPARSQALGHTGTQQRSSPAPVELTVSWGSQISD